MYTDDGEGLERWSLSLLAGEHFGRRKQLSRSGGPSGKGSAEVCDDPSFLF